MSSIIPLEEIKLFVHDDVTKDDRKNICFRLVRREVVLRYIDILETNDEAKIAELDDEVSMFPFAFSIACKDANIELDKDLTFDIAAQLSIFMRGIKEFGNDGIMKKLVKLMCQMTYEDDTLWIEMGKTFMEHDTSRGVRILIEKTARIRALENAYTELISSGELNAIQANTLMIKRGELINSYRFFTSV